MTNYSALLHKWSMLDEPFQQNLGRGAKDAPYSGVEIGPNNVCLVASHSVHFMSPKSGLKKADQRTGGLVRLLARIKGASAVFKNTFNKDNKQFATCWQRVEELSKSNPNIVVLDVHGTDEDVDFDIAINTGSGTITPEQAVMLEIIERHARFAKIKVAVNPHGHKGSNKTKLTEKAKIAGLSKVLQIELAKGSRNPFSHPEKSAAALAFLTTLVETLGS